MGVPNYARGSGTVGSRLRMGLAADVVPPSERRRSLEAALIRAMNRWPDGSIGRLYFSQQYADLCQSGSVVDGLVCYRRNKGQVEVDYAFACRMLGVSDLRQSASE